MWGNSSWYSVEWQCTSWYSMVWGNHDGAILYDWYSNVWGNPLWLILYGMGRSFMIDTLWYEVILYDWYSMDGMGRSFMIDTLWYGAIHHDNLWYGAIHLDNLWYGPFLHDWYSMVWDYPSWLIFYGMGWSFMIDTLGARLSSFSHPVNTDNYTHSPT